MTSKCIGAIIFFAIRELDETLAERIPAELFSAMVSTDYLMPIMRP